MKRLITPSWYREKRLLITHVLLAVGVVLALAGTIQASRDNHTLAVATHRAVCTLRADLVQRADSAQRFLDAHPGGFAGFTRKEIQQTITNEHRTIRSLSTAHCEVTPP